MYQRSDIREGMTVRSLDGEKLGKVFAVQDGEFLIEKGLFFPKDYVCRYSEISDIRDGEIILMHGREGLHRFSQEEDRGVLAGTGGGAGVGPGAVGVPPERPMVSKGEAAVPVYRAVDEEVIIRKDAGEEEQRVTETVRREEVQIRGDEEVDSSRKLDMSPDDPKLRH